MDKELQYQFNKQINVEIYSAYLYLAMATAVARQGLGGAAHWLTQQYYEEMMHARKLIDYVTARAGEVRFYTIDSPKEQFGTVVDVFNEVLAHEQYVTSRIVELVGEAEYAADAEAQTFLQWFINEQKEEEETASKIVAFFAAAAEDQTKIAEVDAQLGQRN
ncbi:MAG: ferritin [Negativicutes bacterium]